MIVALSLLVAVVGMLFYFMASHAKVAELGRIAFGCGLLAFLLQISEKTISFLR